MSRLQLFAPKRCSPRGDCRRESFVYSRGRSWAWQIVCVSRADFRSIARAALCAAAFTFLSSLPGALADEERRSGEPDLRTVLFGSLDAGHSTFGSLGVKRALGGPLDHSGPVGMASLGYGGTDERLEGPEGPRLTRHAVQASALLGYQWARDGVFLAVFAGPEVEGDRLNRSASLPRMTDAHLGVRLHGEVWAHPTANTLFTTTMIVGTARTEHLWARSSAGYAFWDGVFLGPEASVYATDTYPA